jgi:hypothetical protein
MDHIGFDVHNKDSQICILAEGGERIEQRVRTEPRCFAETLGDRPRARIVIESSTESEWVARCLEGLSLSTFIPSGLREAVLEMYVLSAGSGLSVRSIQRHGSDTASCPRRETPSRGGPWPKGLSTNEFPLNDSALGPQPARWL